MKWKFHENDGKQFTDQEIADGLIESEGVIVRAASLLQCSRMTVYRYIEESEDLKELMVALREVKHNDVINKLHEQIDNGELTAIIFYLKTQCKHLNYSERFNSDNDTNGKVNIIFEAEIIDGYTKTTQVKPETN